MSGTHEPASHRWHHGFLRLYLVVAAFWLIGFGYTAYDANRQMSIASREMKGADALYRDSGWTDEFWNKTYRDQQEQWDEQKGRRTFALYALPLFPVGAPILYLISMWIIAGFMPVRRPKPTSPQVAAGESIPDR
jgi:hypothetical protein